MFKKAHADYLEKTIWEEEKFSNTKPLTIFFISDIHKRIINDETLSKTDEVDLTVIGGDLCEKGVSLKRIKENIVKLKNLNAPVIFVWGNNDYEINFHDLEVLLKENGVHILCDEVMEFELANEFKLSVIGLDSPSIKDVYPNYAFDNAIGEYVILAIHEPKTYHLLTEQQQNRVDLVLSGHTHGGQIRILGWGLQPRGGWKQKGKSNFLISEGYGTTKLPLRLGTRATCHQITIHSKSFEK